MFVATSARRFAAGPLDRCQIGPSFAVSLLWLSAIIWVAVTVHLTVSMVALDVLADRHRSGEEFEDLTLLFPAIIGAFVIVGVFLVFALSQLIQGVAAYFIAGRFGRYAYLIILALLPITAILTWYCFDYLVPADPGFMNHDPDWEHFRHGISLARYGITLAAQAAVTMFTIVYSDAAVHPGRRTRIVLCLFVLAVVGSAVSGHSQAVDQYRSSQHPSAPPPR